MIVPKLRNKIEMTSEMTNVKHLEKIKNFFKRIQLFLYCGLKYILFDNTFAYDNFCGHFDTLTSTSLLQSTWCCKKVLFIWIQAQNVLSGDILFDNTLCYVHCDKMIWTSLTILQSTKCCVKMILFIVHIFELSPFFLCLFRYFI